MTIRLNLRASSTTDADAVFVDRGRRGPTSHRHTIGMHRLGTPFGMKPASQRPPWYVERYPVTAVDAAAGVVRLGGLDNYDSFADGLFDGAELLPFHVSEAGIAEGPVPVRVTRSRIRAVRAPCRDRCVPVGAAAEVRTSPPVFSRPGAAYHFAVASVDAAGRRSAWVAAGPVAVATTLRPGPDSPPDVPDTVVGDLMPLYGVEGFDPTRAPETALPPPAGVSVALDNEGRQFVVRWSAAADETAVAGYVVAQSNDGGFTPLEEVVVDDPRGLAEGDFVYLRLRNDGSKTRSEVLSPRADGSLTLAFWGVDLGNPRRPFRGDDPDLDWSWGDVDGEGHVRLTLRPGKRYGWWTARHVDPAALEIFYPPLKPLTDYTFTFRGRAVGAPGRVVVSWGTADDAQSVIAVGTDWGEYRATYRTPAKVATVPRVMLVEARFDGGPDGASYDVRHLACAETRYLGDPTAPTDEQLAEMRRMRPRYNRFHLVKGGPYGIMPLDFMSTRGLANRDGLSLPQLLRWVRDCNADLAPEDLAETGMCPWIQVPPYWRSEEYGWLAEYLCTPYDPATDAPADKPWAFLRHSQGQAAPWQDVFPEIMLEAGNEPWNGQKGFYHYVGADRFDTGGGRVNAFMLDRLAAAFATNPDLRPDRWRWYLNLWIAGGAYADGKGFNHRSLARSTAVTHAGYAGYIGGWDVSRVTLQADAQGFRSVLTDPYGPTRPGHPASHPRRVQVAERLARDMAACSRDKGRPVVAEMYEQGPGYQVTGVPLEAQRSQEAVMKGLAAGTGFFGGVLVAASRGVAGQNFFLYRAASTFSSHAPEILGGAPSGAWQWFAWSNRWAIGETVELDLELTGEVEGPGGLGAGRSVSAFRITAADHVTYVMLNFDPDRSQRVEVPKPRSVAGPVTRWWMTGEVTTTNATVETADAMRIMSMREPEGWGADRIEATIPAGQCVAWVFDTRPPPG